MRLWFSETLMGGITQALFTRRRPPCCRQAGGLPGAAAPGWAGMAPWGGDAVQPVTPKPPERGATPGQRAGPPKPTPVLPWARLCPPGPPAWGEGVTPGWQRPA